MIKDAEREGDLTPVGVEEKERGRATDGRQ